jgi:hypothetical protein
MRATASAGKASFKRMVGALNPGALIRWVRRQRRRRRDRQLFQRALRPTDVFLVGSPKSGNTWLAYMLAAVMERTLGKKVTLANVSEFIPTIHARDSQIAAYDRLPAPRIFRNEGPVYPESYPKTIYLIRDPRAVMVSYYHHCVHDTGDHDWPMQDFVDEMLTRGHVRNLEPFLVRWDRQVLQWLERAQAMRVKIVKYEDMIADRRKVLEDVLGFVGLAYDREDVTSAVARGSFEHMRRDEQLHGAEAYSRRQDGAYFIRRGKVDGWKTELSQDLVRRIEDEFSHAMKRVGYL